MSFQVMLAVGLLGAQVNRPGDFERYTNDILAKVPNADGVLRVKKLTPELLASHSGVLGDARAAFIVVKTNEGRWSKLLVAPAQQRIADKSLLPILVIERFVTYKEGEERTVAEEGNNIRLFPDFHFGLDLGHIVPASVGGDLRMVVKGDNVFTEPVGKAEIYLVTKPLPEAAPKQQEKIVVKGAFDPRYFTGSYKLLDDGRRGGKLVLKVADDGFVDGWFYSDKDGAKYQVTGKVGVPGHTLKFKIHMPKTVIDFQGWMFTGDARAICGVSRIQERESGFYAVRLEDD